MKKFSGKRLASFDPSWSFELGGMVVQPPAVLAAATAPADMIKIPGSPKYRFVVEGVMIEGGGTSCTYRSDLPFPVTLFDSILERLLADARQRYRQGCWRATLVGAAAESLPLAVPAHQAVLHRHNSSDPGGLR